MRSRTWVAVVMTALSLAACQRETRRFRESPPAATAANAVTLSPLQPGPQLYDVAVVNAYEKNAYAVSEGQRLFSQYNCSGCHSHGGGGMGPPLMDDQWIYGSEPENIFSTIVEGRPNGMPSFRGKLPNEQVWELVAYVRSLGGLLPKDVAPAREDHMVTAPEPQRTEPQHPKASFTPPASVTP